MLPRALLPPLLMTTIIERDVSGDSGISSAITAFVAVIAILFVVGVALYVLRVYPFNVLSAGFRTTPPMMNVNVTGSLPSTNPSGR